MSRHPFCTTVALPAVSSFSQEHRQGGTNFGFPPSPKNSTTPTHASSSMTLVGGPFCHRRNTSPSSWWRTVKDGTRSPTVRKGRWGTGAATPPTSAGILPTVSHSTRWQSAARQLQLPRHPPQSSPGAEGLETNLQSHLHGGGPINCHGYVLTGGGCLRLALRQQDVGCSSTRYESPRGL